MTGVGELVTLTYLVADDNSLEEIKAVGGSSPSPRQHFFMEDMMEITAKVKIIINTTEIEISFDEAKTLKNKLVEMFGEREYIYIPSPIPYIPQFPLYNPYDPNYITVTNSPLFS